MFQNFRADLRNKAVLALRMLVLEIRRLSPDHDHAQTMVAFLAGIYNGSAYPFNLCRLREIDAHNAMACVQILQYNCLRTEEEIHEWGVFDADELHRWIDIAGICRERDLASADRARSFEYSAGDARQMAVAALDCIAEVIRSDHGHGQRQQLTAFLGSLFNSRFPFDPFKLRALDRSLKNACLLVLNYDSFDLFPVHKLGVITGDELESWLHKDGHYYEAQRRRIAHQLYSEKFGKAGHPDEGHTG